ncbi:MAG: hypothetical protein AB8B91_09780 [Rubripirellula sp.]
MSEERALPGAGLPAFERGVANVVMRVGSRLLPRSRVVGMIDAESRRVVDMCGVFSSELGMQRVLIDRIMGIEDNSRDWSAYMTLQHMCIVNEAMVGILQALDGGAEFDREVRIQDVKPAADAGPECVQTFQTSVEGLQQCIAGIQQPVSAKTQAHPWFGEMNARQWTLLAGVHLRIHRKQIESIRSSLRL